MDFKDLNKQLQEEFAKKKIRAEWIATKNKKHANSVPAYAKLTVLEKEIMFELARCKVNNQPTTEYAKSLKTIRSEKQHILKELGLSAADLEPKYECTLCNDIGFVGSKMCDCFQKRRNEEIVKRCGLDINKNVTFENFNTDICKNPKHAKELSKLKDKLVEWSKKFPNVKKKNIIISGTPGGGKTYLTQCLANEMLKQKCSVCFVSAFDMNNMFLKYHTTFDISKNSYLDPLINSDLLFIDDLGTEPITKNVTLNYLFLVLSERERFGKPMIVSTNLRAEDILNRYNERIYSRLTNKMQSFFVFIEGEDLRTSK